MIKASFAGLNSSFQICLFLFSRMIDDSIIEIIYELHIPDQLYNIHILHHYTILFKSYLIVSLY